MHPLVLAIDIGSTRLKAALIDAQGSAVRRVQQDSPLQETPPCPAAVQARVAEVARAVCKGTRPDAIAVTGATRTTVLTGDDGQAIGAAIPLGDGRGASFADTVQAAYGATSPRGLGAFHPLARMLDVQRNEPDAYRRMRWALDLKDWLNLQLTGQAQVDTVAMARTQPADGDVEAVLARLRLRPGMMGTPTAPAHRIGIVHDTAPSDWHWCRGVPVVQCGFDAWCASFGMGAVRANAVYNVSGTTDVFGGFAPQAQAVDGIACLPWCPGLWHLGGPCLTGLATLAWFGKQFLGNPDPAAVIACAATATGDDGPLALPFVHGERMPFWRPDLRARFLDVDSRHGTPEFARALIDGLLLFQRWLIGQLTPRTEAVYLGGGGCSLAGWPQSKAAAFGLPVRIVDNDEPALLGAAICAQVALGRYPSLLHAQEALRPGHREIAPDAATMRRLQASQARFLAHLQHLLAA